jgi:hypothetical protein
METFSLAPTRETPSREQWRLKGMAYALVKETEEPGAVVNAGLPWDFVTRSANPGTTL